MKQWLIILLSCAAFHRAAFSQSNSISFRNININEGLSQSSVVDIAVDNKGFLWFATQDGLNRFDGKEFVIFKKTFDDITTASGSTTGKLAVGHQNDLWIVTSGGKLERMNLHDQSITEVPVLNGVQLPPVSCIYPGSDGSLWIGTEEKGLLIYNEPTKDLFHYTADSSSKVILAGNRVEDISKNKQGRIFVVTNLGVTVFDNKISAITSHYLKDEKNNLAACSVLAEDSRGSIWFGTYGAGLYLKKRNGTVERFTGFPGSQKISENLTIFSILADQFNRIWIGTYGHGLYIVNQADSTITNILSDNKNSFSLGYNDVLIIRKDIKGGIWVGTDGGGVSYYDRRLNNFTLVSSSNVGENVSVEQIRSLTMDDQGIIWIGTSNNGLTYMDQSGDKAETIHFSPYKKGINNPDRIVSLLTDRDGDLWVGTQGNGLIILDPKTKRIKRQFYPDSNLQSTIPDHTIWCMHPADRSNIWIGTRHGGLSLINKKTGVVKNYLQRTGNINSIAENNVRKIISINDSILCIGYETKGVQFFNIKQNRFINIPPLDAYWHSEINIKTLFYKHPILWIGTLGKGIVAYNIVSKKVDLITEERGLPNHTIYGILPDQKGSLWISSNRGICRFTPPADLNKLDRSHFTLFSVEDGLQSNEFNTGAYHRSETGLLFFGGIKGLNFFNPDKMVITKQPINTAIIHVTINNKAYQGDTNIIYKKSLYLKHNNNSLSFSFAALDFVSVNKLSYYYQLSDYEQTWINAGNRNYASYTNLPPGKYIFKVKASNDLPTSRDAVTTLSIHIAPPFWRTWWFILLSAVAFAGILYLLYRYRINQLIQLQKVRNRIATDLHDDIGSTLTNISILSELSRKNIQDQQQTRNFLNRISEEVYFSNQALDDIVWSINTSNDTLAQTVARMRRYAAEMFDGANISYSLHLEEQFEHHKLNMDQRRDCFLLFKEAINNIYKHAHAKNVSIKVWIEKNHLIMEIKDDGTGFDTSELTTRNGIKNMHSRIKKWKGSIKIISAQGKGTSTELKFPL